MDEHIHILVWVPQGPIILCTPLLQEYLRRPDYDIHISESQIGANWCVLTLCYFPAKKQSSQLLWIWCSMHAVKGYPLESVHMLFCYILIWSWGWRDVAALLMHHMSCSTSLYWSSPLSQHILISECKTMTNESLPKTLKDAAIDASAIARVQVAAWPGSGSSCIIQYMKEVREQGKLKDTDVLHFSFLFLYHSLSFSLHCSLYSSLRLVFFIFFLFCLFVCLLLF